jgi:zinc transport system ATP-binding protein
MLDHCSLFGLTTGLAVLEVRGGGKELEQIICNTLPDCQYLAAESTTFAGGGPESPPGGVSRTFDVVVFNSIGLQGRQEEFARSLALTEKWLRPGGIIIVADFIGVDPPSSPDSIGMLEEAKRAFSTTFADYGILAFHPTSARLAGSDPDIKTAAMHLIIVLESPGTSSRLTFGSDDLTFEMKRPFTHALRTDTPFGVFRGKWNLIVGRSGSGKTSFLRALQGDLTPYAPKARGFPSDNYFYMPQSVDVFESLTPVQNVRAYGGDQSTAHEFFDDLGMPDFSTRRHTAEISGGERQRLLVAQIMAARPQLIILDEPSKGLDRAGRLITFEALADCFAEAAHSASPRTTLVCADHDFAAVYNRFDHVFEIRNGRQVLVWSKPDEC